MVLEAQVEYSCLKQGCEKSWAIEPEVGYYDNRQYVNVGGDPKDLRIDPKHIVCPFCGSREVVKCD